MFEKIAEYGKEIFYDRKKSFRFFILISSFIVVDVSAIAIFVSVQERSRIKGEAEQQLNYVALTFANYVSQSLVEADRAIFSSQQMMLAEFRSPSNGSAIIQSLKALVNNSPEVLGLGLYDKYGNPIQQTGYLQKIKIDVVLPTIQVAHEKSWANPLVFNSSDFGNIINENEILVSRSLFDGDGQNLGFGVAVISLSEFENIFNMNLLGSGVQVRTYNSQGKLLFSSLKNNGSKHLDSTSDADPSRNTLLVERDANNYPLFAIATRPYDGIFETWVFHTVFLSFGALFSIALLILIAWLIRKAVAGEIIRQKEFIRHSQVLNQINAVPYEIDLNRKVFTFIGPQMLGILGFEPSSLLVTSDWEKHIHPDDLQDRIEKNRVPFLNNKTEVLEYRVENAQGKYLWIQSSVVYVLENGVKLARGIITDISKLKELQDLLSSERKALEDIIWGTSVGTWEWDVQTGETKFNELWANIIGYSLSELEPISIKTWMEHAYPDDLPKSEALLEKHFSGEVDHYDFECRMVHRDGHLVWVQDRGKVTEWSKEGKPLKMAGTHTDISYRKKVEEDLELAKKAAEHANNSKSDFLANMSHELRTPMIGIRGVLDLFKKNRLIVKEAGGLLGDLDDSSSALMRLLDDILDLSKIEAGKIALEYSPQFPAKIINGIVNTFGALSSQKDVQITTNLEDYSHYCCLLDELRFRQIISNLVSNAVKFTHEGEINISINIDCTPSQDFLIVHVSDSGIGMTTESIEKIFQRFEQGDQGTTRKFGGTGLGLTISKELTDLFKGSLEVNSTIDVGSTFTLSLPVDKAEMLVKQQIFADLEPLEVLLAEDNIINQHVLSAMLETHGHFVTIANNGVEAVKHASEKMFDVILMDMQMPVMDGEEATRLIRSTDNPNREQPILAFTADALKEHKDRFLKAGVNDIVLKPIKWADLQEILRKTIKRND